MTKFLFLFAILTIVSSITTSNDDLVDKASINKLGLNYTETVYSGYLPVNTDGSA